MTLTGKQIMHRDRTKNGLKMVKSGLLITELFWRQITFLLHWMTQKRKSADVHKTVSLKQTHLFSCQFFCSNWATHNLTIAIMLTRLHIKKRLLNMKYVRSQWNENYKSGVSVLRFSSGLSSLKKKIPENITKLNTMAISMLLKFNMFQFQLI